MIVLGDTRQIPYVRGLDGFAGQHDKLPIVSSDWDGNIYRNQQAVASLVLSEARRVSLKSSRKGEFAENLWC